MKAYIFPGQGSQFIGMGKDLYENSPLAKELFEKANTILGFRITDTMFGGTDEELKQTKPELLKGFDLLSNTDANFAPTKNMPLVGGFWWGCCLGVVGLALVYFITDHDKDQVRKAFLGCVVATVIWGIGGLWNPFGW